MKQIAVFLLLTAVLGGALVRAADPSEPLRIIVPFGAGGGSDTFVRVIQSGAKRAGTFGQPIVVINVPGGGGSIGSLKAKDAEPDGLTILCLHEGIFTAKHNGNAAYGAEAFEPIAATGRVPSVVAVSEDSPYQTLGDLLNAAAETPDTLTMAANPGAPSHFTGLDLQSQVEGASFRIVPSGGGADRYGQLVGGHIDMSAFSVPEILQYRTSGLRTLAVLSEERHPSMPEVPTAREQGFDVVRSTTQYWWAPLGTPPERIAELAGALKATVAEPETARRLDDLQYEPIFLTGDSLVTAINAEEARTAAVAREELDVFSMAPFLAALAGLLGAGVVAQSLLSRNSEMPAGDGEDVALTSFREGLVRAVLIIILLAAYVFAITRFDVPFSIATAVFIPLAGLILGVRSAAKILVTVVLGLALGFGLELLFTRVLPIDLP